MYCVKRMLDAYYNKQINNKKKLHSEDLNFRCSFYTPESEDKFYGHKKLSEPRPSQVKVGGALLYEKLLHF